jgi:tetratricopeptide (TPR) repeat protein
MRQAFVRHLLKILIPVWLACWPVGAMVWAQESPCERMQEAIEFERRGQFDAAINVLKPVVAQHQDHEPQGHEPQDVQQLSGVELGRAYIVLGGAYKEEGRFSEAQSAFEQSLHILEQDGGHGGDYASALENYAGLYDDMGQIDVAAPMWMKALRLRQRVGDHAGAMLSLTNLAGVAIAQKQFHEAEDLVKKAVDEMKLARDLTYDYDLRLLETRAQLALAEGHAAAAVTQYQSVLEICRRVRGERHWITGWEHMLLGKAYAKAGNVKLGLAEMREGLEILEQGAGRNTPKYFMAEIAYAQVLDQSGSHLEAARLRTTVEQARKDLYGAQFAGCTISVAGFR